MITQLVYAAAWFGVCAFGYLVGRASRMPPPFDKRAWSQGKRDGYKLGYADGHADGRCGLPAKPGTGVA